MANAYDHLSKWFELLNDDCDYATWSQYFIDGLARLGAGKRGLELGCGSGAFCRALASAGYEMTGADLSAPMLTEGVKRAREAGVRVDFIQADAARLHVPKPFDFIVSPNDCYNYVSQEKLPSAFARAASSLKTGGIFWIDVSSACKLREKIANNIFADDRDDITYLCFNSLKKDRVEMDVTLFVKEKDGRFCRFDEKHVQYIHEEEQLVSALKSVGFDVIAVEGHLGGAKEGSDRLNLICRKQARS